MIHYSNLIANAAEEMILQQGPMTAEEISEQGYEINWLMIGGEGGDRAKVPVDLIEKSLKTNTRVRKGGSGRWHLSGND
jgi:hypothetical protein